MNLGQLMSGHFSRTFPAEAIAAFESMNVFLNPANTGFPLKAGFELYIGATGEKENLKKQFRFDVGLSEPGIVDGAAPRNGKSLAELVDGIVTELTPRLG